MQSILPLFRHNFVYREIEINVLLVPSSYDLEKRVHVSGSFSSSNEIFSRLLERDYLRCHPVRSGKPSLSQSLWERTGPDDHTIGPQRDQPEQQKYCPPTDPEDDGPEDCAKRARNIIRMAFLTDEQQQLETAREMELTMQSFDGFWHMVGEDDETAEKRPSRQTCRKLPQRAATSSYCREPPPAPAAVTTSRHCQSPQATTASSRRCVRRPCRDSSPQEAVASRRRQEKTPAQARRLKPPPQHTVDATHNQQQPLT